jgi:outer membrane protein assembly factor BamB
VASLAGQRRGYAYAGISDITADPVIVGGSVYAGTQSGRFAKLDLATGERIWTATEGAYSPGVPVGGSVFIVSDQGQLVRLDDASGAVIWAVDLPYYRKDRPRRLRAVTEHYGPVLAGGQVIVGSDDGRLRFFSPEDGTLRLEADLPGGAASLPAVVGGTLYILSGNGQLHAFR